ncbi:small capsid protein [Canid alphaherpesvirus 1]|uniref:Small capsomere-interacting protein n=1 Tax=Canid alphaherpesvirus 1 TaxID=170325 RepID=A0A172DSH9_9ALPH|nr:small capsid protein [Canid alphaherpesvirus 1]ALL25899.1 small capsid protein [Canid alphaherpesvirus 1]ALL25979.1 small capsid protein [Canid alphaherpesvirus 1]ALL26055.1 small capsid protein [Canid alphaherpesvirus 1]AQX83336.1 small capsid protein [Canid alphaherpesvirus 1]ARE29827.1 small capsid protein [Canid alphaherpesvirus 1]
MASFNPADLKTITAANLRGLLPAQIITIINQSNHPNNASPAEILDAQRNLLIGTSLSMVALRQRHANHTIARVPMFAEYDGLFWARPTIGLKRTFSPRLTQIVPDE